MIFHKMSPRTHHNSYGESRDSVTNSVTIICNKIAEHSWEAKLDLEPKDFF